MSLTGDSPLEGLAEGFAEDELRMESRTETPAFKEKLDCRAGKEELVRSDTGSAWV